MVPLLVECVDAVGDALEQLSEADMAEPSVLPGWSVRDLAAHLVVVADSVRHLEPLPANAGVLSIAEYLAGYADRADRITGLTQEAAAELADIPRGYQERWDEALAHLRALQGAEKVLARRGAARLADLVATRIIEFVVHADDLARSVPAGAPAALPPQAQRLVARVLLDVLAARQPGHAVEVRVPPVAAVQCLPGPRHTRGTPPNVVETDPTTWTRLAAGRLGWTAALAEGAVRASGARADLSAALPLL
jgi:uncharacterized protein (TIGR03083 family)